MPFTERHSAVDRTLTPLCHHDPSTTPRPVPEGPPRLPRRHVLRTAAAAALVAGPLRLSASPSPLAHLSAALLTPEQAAPLLAAGRLQALDLRDAQLQTAPFAFDGGQIPGSRPLATNSLMGPAHNPGLAPNPAGLLWALEQVGARAETPTLLIPSHSGLGPLSVACRAGLLLSALGVPSVALLRGSVDDWTAAGLPLDLASVADHLRTPGPAVQLAAARAGWRRPQLLVDSRTLWHRLQPAQATAPPRLLDLRSRASYQGERRHRLAARWGRIPTSRSLPIREWLNADQTDFRSIAELREVADRHGLLDGRPTVLTCNTGLLASVAWFALAVLLHQPQVSVHAESMVGWSRAGLPLEAEPPRPEQLRRSLLGLGVDA